MNTFTKHRNINKTNILHLDQMEIFKREKILVDDLQDNSCEATKILKKKINFL